jgi:DNA processing protein
MNRDTASRLDRWRRSFRDSAIEQKLRERGIRCLLPGDSDWPTRLSDLADMPRVVFARGPGQPAPVAGGLPTVAIVGTRRASSYGIEAARWISETLACAGIEIISGMALGIDGSAHQAALSCGGATTALLASGVDVCYPSSHQALYQQICEHGLVLSEYAPGSPVAKHRFPERNRLIAALADAVVVVQAGDKSGALRTVEQALELGRDIYVVPGPITAVHFRGSHRLLQDGARILVDPADLLADLGLTQTSVAATQVPARWQDLFDCLDEPMTAASLERKLSMRSEEVYAGLLELEVSGWIERVPGGLYCRVRQRSHAGVRR